MKNSYRIFAASRLVVVIYSRHPTFSEWREMMMQIFEHPNYQPGFDFVFDKSWLNEAASTAHVEAVSSFVSKHCEKLNRCAIVTAGPVVVRMARMVGSDCPDDQVQAFRDRDEAVEWLCGRASESSDLPPPAG